MDARNASSQIANELRQKAVRPLIRKEKLMNIDQPIMAMPGLDFCVINGGAVNVEIELLEVGACSSCGPVFNWDQTGSDTACEWKLMRHDGVLRRRTNPIKSGSRVTVHPVAKLNRW